MKTTTRLCASAQRVSDATMNLLVVTFHVSRRSGHIRRLAFVISMTDAEGRM
jgi:hypothetical protein